MRQLTIISHTEHYKTPEGHIVGLGATVTEINQLLEIFDTIVHVAVLYETDSIYGPASCWRTQLV